MTALERAIQLGLATTVLAPRHAARLRRRNLAAAYVRIAEDAEREQDIKTMFHAMREARRAGFDWSTWRRRDRRPKVRLLAGLAIALLAAGCAVGDAPIFEPPAAFSIAFDPACDMPSVVERPELARAVELWRQVDVDVDEVDAAPDGWVCLRPGAPRAGYAGWQSWAADGAAYLEVSRAVRRDMLGPLLAHEIAHALLPGDGDEDHLPAGGTGLLAAQMSVSWSWSADDVDWLVSWGFSPVAHASLRAR